MLEKMRSTRLEHATLSYLSVICRFLPLRQFIHTKSKHLHIDAVATSEAICTRKYSSTAHGDRAQVVPGTRDTIALLKELE